MYNVNSNSREVYIVANVDTDGNVDGFPMGGGSSTKPAIKAHPTYGAAKKASRFFPGSVVVKVLTFEVVEEASAK